MKYYAAGWNMPGYMPEMDVAHFDNFDDAKRYIIDEMLSVADSVEDEDDAEEITNDAEDVNLESREFVYGPYDGYVYWVSEIPESDYDPGD
jgi:hypothetical protein